MSLLARIRWRLSAEGFFWFQLIGGAIAIVASAAVFGLIAGNLTDGQPLTILDGQVANWFHVNAMTPVTRLMLLVSQMNGIGGISALTVLLVLAFAWKREWYWTAFAALAIPGGMLLNVLVKSAFHRARPSFTDPLATLASYSFPSGHTLASTLFYGTLVAFLVPRVGATMRIVIVVAAIVMVGMVGLSRIYLGAHFLSDVVAAVAEGIAWLSLCLTALATYRRHRIALAAVQTQTAS